MTGVRKAYDYLTTYSDYLALVCLTAMIWLSLSPLQELPALAGGDKLHHLVAYASLVFLGVLRRGGLRGIVLIVVGAVTLGGVVEMVQPHVNRYGEVEDFIANCIGVMIGVCLGSLVRIHARRQSHRESAQA